MEELKMSPLERGLYIFFYLFIFLHVQSERMCKECAQKKQKLIYEPLLILADGGGWNVRSFRSWLKEGRTRVPAMAWSGHTSDVPGSHRSAGNSLEAHLFEIKPCLEACRSRRCVVISDSCQGKITHATSLKSSVTSRSREPPSDTDERPDSAEFYQTKLPPDLYWDVHNGSWGPSRPVKNQQWAETLITELSNIFQTGD